MNDYEIPADVREAFIYLFGEDELRENGGDDETIMEAYQGEYASDVDFAAEMLDATGDLDQMPKHLRYYFDYEKYARDLMIDDFVEHNHHYFYRNW